MPDQPDIEIEKLAAPERERFGQLIAVAIVVTTLLAALCGYLQAHALLHNDDALARAQQWSAFASRITDQDQQAQQLMTARQHRSHSERLEAGYDTAQAQWGGQPSAATSATQLSALAATTDADSRRLASGLRAQFASVRALDEKWLSDREALDAGDGRACTRLVGSGRGGSAYPYLAGDQRTYYQLDGLREAADVEAAASEKQFTRYAVSLAILAVAVFLLGYSLTPHGRHHRKLYALTAGVLVLGASLWGVYAAVRSPQQASAESMAAYADGRVALDNGDYGTAVRYFSCAISQQPNFASAYQWRSSALMRNTKTFFQISPHDLDRIISDAEQARTLGSNDPQLINNLSASLFVSGVRRRDRAQIAQAESLMRGASLSDPSHPVIAMNFAVDRLTLGQPWRQDFSKAERVDLQAGDRWKMRQTELGGLTMLWDTHIGRGLRSALSAAKQHLVASLSAGSQPAMSYAPPRGLLGYGGAPRLSVSLTSRNGDLGITPGQAEFFIDGGTGFDPTRDHLYAAWYERSGSVWQTVDGLSGPVQRNAANQLETSTSAPDQNRLFSLATRGPGSDCLGRGEYKVELYVNGALAGQASVFDPVTETMTSTPLPDMGSSVCRPSQWQPLPNSQPGLVEGYVSPTKNAGMLAVDASAGAPSAVPSTPLLHRVLQSLGRKWLPAGLSSRQTVGNAFAGGLCGEYVEEYSYRGGKLAAGIGRDAYGRELVGITYAPDYATLNNVFTSMVADTPPPSC